MRKYEWIIIFVVAALLGYVAFGCASFGGPPVVRTDLVVPPITTMTADIEPERLEILITNKDTSFAYCSDQASGVVCEFSLEYLLSEARLTMSSWEDLDRGVAMRICYNGMFTIVRFNEDGTGFQRASPGLIETCAYELLFLRFTTLTPEKINPKESK